MTGTELRKRRKKMLLTQAVLAEIIGVATNSVAQWERGERPIPRPMSKLLADIENDVLYNPSHRGSFDHMRALKTARSNRPNRK